MTSSARLEHDLTEWLQETAMPRTPDYADEILDRTARIRQRPRWTFIGRRGAMAGAPRGVAGLGGRAVATAALLVALALLLAAVATFVGGRRTVPPPFGLAGNGWIAHEQRGRIQLIDPETLAIVSVVGSAGRDHEPRWSLDGTRLAFLRDRADGQTVVVADATGRVVSISEPFTDVDPDAIGWSPDGQHVAVAAGRGLDRGLYLVDAPTGAVRGLALPYDDLEAYWRPLGEPQLLFHAGGVDPGLYLLTVRDGTVERVAPEVVGQDLRPLGWTPDGTAFLYQQAIGAARETVYVADLESGTATALEVAWGHVSNDGTRVVGLDNRDRMCVTAISGGPCRAIADVPGWNAATAAALTWSPDDRWLAVYAASDDSIWLVDPEGVAATRRLPSTGTPTWQRTAP
jgi:Tol biopolymer transport system component